MSGNYQLTKKESEFVDYINRELASGGFINSHVLERADRLDDGPVRRIFRAGLAIGMGDDDDEDS